MGVLLAMTLGESFGSCSHNPSLLQARDQDLTIALTALGASPKRVRLFRVSRFAGNATGTRRTSLLLTAGRARLRLT
jgi:hypothetical protein